MDWIYSPDDQLLKIIGACIFSFAFIILITKIIGLRSFAKFTTYDFAITVAIGSIISSTLTSSTSLAVGFTAISGLLVLTLIFSIFQKKSNVLNKLISNKPILLMEGKEILYDNLKKSRVHKDQLIAKLREANVANFDQVIAVVLETTGDISVLHRSTGKSDEFDDALLTGVKDL